MIDTFMFTFVILAVIAYSIYAYKAYKYSLKLYSEAQNLENRITWVKVEYQKLNQPCQNALALIKQANEEYESALFLLEINELYKANKCIELGRKLADNALYFIFIARTPN